MQYSLLVSLIFLGAVLSINAMQDKKSSDGSSLIKITSLKKTPSDKAEKAKELPRSNNPCLQGSQIPKFHRKTSKCS